MDSKMKTRKEFLRSAASFVTACEIVGGCPGNARGIAKLILGRKATDVIATLKGIPCRNGTSCPDQLARALEAEISAGRVSSIL